MQTLRSTRSLPPILRRLRAGVSASGSATHAAIRGELFSAERLELHARSLAEAQGLGRKGRGRPLDRRLAENQAVLLSAYRDTAKALDEGASITPAAEWLIDNFHLVERQIREIRLDLPPGYYRELPKIATGHLAGHPRVFGIAWAFVAHTDSHFDCELLCRFLGAYQEIQPLTIGELWAVAITLRIVLVENLRRIAERIVFSRAARAAADDCCDHLMEGVDSGASSPSDILGAYREGLAADAFVVQLGQRLRDANSAAAPALTWLDERLAERGASTEEIVRDEHQRQVAASVTVRNIVTSMRLISDVDWAEIVERSSMVDDVLKAGSAFADMDFPTRNLYRNAIEELARGSGQSELQVARTVIQTVSQVDDISGEGRRCDPGYYLIGGGRRTFETALRFRPPLETWPARAVRALGLGAYLAALLAVTSALLLAPLALVAVQGVGPAWVAILAVLGAVPALDAAIALVNRGITGGLRATPLAALELKGGIPQKLRTVVAAPVLFANPADVEEHLERLEIHHLSSPEGHLHFALLSDWPDAATEIAENDAALLQAARDGVDALNRKYGAAPGGDRFLLLHRNRVWSESEGCWMGWERKRGKLHELNRLLRGANNTSFIGLQNQSVPTGVRYVITLDADTKLPRDTVRRLIGKMAHPLNRPHFEPALRRVVEGYGILQPRITPSLPRNGEGSLFRRASSNLGGIDPYAAAVSDVYQDLFGEGSFAGKGIYDVDAFEAALRDRVPEATLLSHDLFEGLFARAGLASDVEVVEDFPDRYDVANVRHHRWARGDWQLLPWILGRGPRPGVASSATAVGRWKMIDNLRRTLSPGVSLTSLWIGWLQPAPAAAVWTLFVLATFLAPPLIPVVFSLNRRRPGVPFRARAHNLTADLQLALLQTALVAAFLAHQAWLMGDAIVRTLWRLLVSRRRLLEWVPAAQAAAELRFDQVSFYRRMAPAVAFGLGTLATCWISGLGSWLLAAPFAVLWIVSPTIAFRASQPPPAQGQPALSETEARRLRLIARRTWRFFEAFVTPADSMLPPDNFQEDPEALAHRTSPTNIGLYLLSAAVARDCGWMGAREALGRIEAAFASLARMPRFRGHFYNWYDTRDLRPLDPQYVSSVDSGNLAGHLIALANTLESWAREAVDPDRRLLGVADARDIVRQELDALREGGGSQSVAWRRIDERLGRLDEGLDAPAGQEPLDARLAQLAPHAEALVDAAEALLIERGAATARDVMFWTQALQQSIASHRADLADDSPAPAIQALATQCRRFALDMDFTFLLDPERMLLSIGYRAAEGERDPSCYDLLGSEAQLASLFAIAKGDVPARHWFRLGHAVTPVAHGAALISWSGSMFEYLMPSLVMRPPPGSVLAQTNRLVVRRQIEYAVGLKTPWGMSESAYNARDLELTYQYLSFGIPGLGLKRGLDEHIVVAPYATALAAMVEPKAALRNFERLEGIGARGRYGFYEAIDFTPGRVPEGQDYALVRAFMAHHQGMSIVAIGNVIGAGVMRTHFHAEPMIQAAELLLEERMPREVVISQPWISRTRSRPRPFEVEAAVARRITTPHTATPAVHLLSNGSYSVMVTAAGAGYSRWRDVAVTRWREDATCDGHGAFVFLRDAHSGRVWSAGHQPMGVEADDYRVTFNEDRVEIARRDGAVTTALEVLVSSEDDGEVRRVSLTNGGFGVREIEVTSYVELALLPQAADVAHPAFAKLFIETEHLPAIGALLATRRRRSRTEPEVWAAHLAVVEGEISAKPEFDTDRAQFLGRGRDLRAPMKLTDGRALGGATGTVLDPALVLRRRVRIAPGATARISFWTLMAPSRKALLDLVDKHHDPAAFDRAANLAWTQALVQLHHLGVDRAEAALFQRLAGHVIYAVPALRPPSEVLERGVGGQPGLWRVGISGDLPIVLVRIDDPHDLGLARQLIKASEYWRARQLAFDLVLLNERASSYVQDLQVTLESLVRTAQARGQLGEHTPAGRTVVLRSDLIQDETRNLLASAARIVLSAKGGSLAEQLDRLAETLEPPKARRRLSLADRFPALPIPSLEFFNGLGGFDKEGREYVVLLEPGQTTPAPWINVVANPEFGFQVSADGAGYTWRGNSREHQLTPWSNDPVVDPTGEALFVRDDETGDLWSPTASPIRLEHASYAARHGRGYSRFEHASHGIETELVQFVPTSDPIKVSRLRIHNVSGRGRRLSVTAYAEWVLGPSRAAAAPFTVTSRDVQTGAILARNGWSPAFGSPAAFADLRGRQTSWTGDRREFLGRNGCLASPASLATGDPLSNTLGAGLDPCAALQTTLELPANATVEVVFLIGEAPGVAEAGALVERYRNEDLDLALEQVERQWDEMLSQIQVKTPDRSLDIMLNGWLLYQTLSCRLWARSGFYQASGAYGFRDQLQDGMAFAAIRPDMTREHLLRAAGRQFAEGDVQHWWLPHSGQGVRTRISDDRVWLAYAAAHYVETADDPGVLDEVVPFIAGAPLEADEAERFFQPEPSAKSASLYEHCARALDVSLDLGGHGLPLFGGGDWNDGMNRVGERGLGESVWLGWLLRATLSSFTPLAEARGDAARVRSWRAHAAALEASLERNAWDGEWYRRGWFDDGEPLGSATSDECRIDSIAQSWAVLSGAGSPERAAKAMAAVQRDLILEDEKLALLFSPAFDRTPLDPGYIKAYPPGIRENGGQYTHAAAWSVMAFARLGEGDQAADLFAMLNPINHALTRSAAHRYKVEPYVVAADVYAAPGHAGRGGWTWYTGSAAWMHRAGLESILGLRRKGGQLIVDPCIPKAWPGFEVMLRRGASTYRIVVENPDGVSRGVHAAELDGSVLAARPVSLALIDDGRYHLVSVRLGVEAAAPAPPDIAAS